MSDLERLLLGLLLESLIHTVLLRGDRGVLVCDAALFFCFPGLFCFEPISLRQIGLSSDGDNEEMHNRFSEAAEDSCSSLPKTRVVRFARGATSWNVGQSMAAWSAADRKASKYPSLSF